MDALLWFGIILVVVWLFVGFIFELTGFLIHLTLVLGVLLLIWWAIRRLA